MSTRPLALPDPSSVAKSWRESAFEWMGGTDVLTAPAPSGVASDLAWVKAVEEGLPTEALEAALGHGRVSWSEVQDLVIPRRTFSHRKARSGRLTPEESDRLVRLLRTVAQAEETFGDAKKARRWLSKPNRALAGEVPLDLLRTAGGARLVEDVLGRIAYGVYS